MASTATRTGWSRSWRLSRARLERSIRRRMARGLAGRLLGLGALLDLHRFAAAVPAAVRAGVMRLLGLMAVRALLELGQRQRVVRATLALARMGYAPLRDSH